MAKFFTCRFGRLRFNLYVSKRLPRLRQEKQGIMTDKGYCGRPARLFLILLLTACFFSPISARNKTGDYFSYAELLTLYESSPLPEPLEIKLNHLLTTPFVDNSHRAGSLSFTESPDLGAFLRVAQWNIERGLEYEAIEAVFAGHDQFEKFLDDEKFPAGSPERRKIIEEAAQLRAADVIVLNEVDWGLKRTEYRNIAAELAARLKMNYALGVQFIELSPVHLSKKKPTENAAENELAEIIKVDPERYKGLHGIAILSRFPLANVRLTPFRHQPYDWYESEKKGAGLLEKGKRQVAKQIFLEESLREVRRGGRTTLFADIVDERLPSGRVTIAATHLENRTKSKNRVRQLEELLESIRELPHPVIVAGDMNTSGSDLTPTSIRRELMKRYGNPRYWIKKSIQYALGFGLVEDSMIDGVSFGRTYADPTVRDIPFLSPNGGRSFFTTIEKFRFADGGAFDFRGESERSANGKRKTLANSNERGRKGFVTTYQVKRPIYLIGKYKLDWIFVKPANLKNPRDYQASYRFAPHFGQTLTALNEIVEDRLSDHRPMIVDLPLEEPVIRKK
jgi:endonuclease/exonuclease/phosphatase family metal-dependent hydrolase